MSNYLEGAGAFYEKSGHPEIGHGFKALAQLGQRAGLPEDLAPQTLYEKEVPEEDLSGRKLQRKKRLFPTQEYVGTDVDTDRLYTDLSECGISDRVSRLICQTVGSVKYDDTSNDLPVKLAGHLTEVSDAELKKKVKGLGTEGIKEIRGSFPYIPPEDLPARRDTENDIRTELAESGLSGRVTNLIRRSDLLAHLGEVTDLSTISDERLQLLIGPGFGPKILDEIREHFPYTPEQEIYPGTEGIAELAQTYEENGYPELGAAISAFGKLGEKTGMPRIFYKQVGSQEENSSRRE